MNPRQFRRAKQAAAIKAAKAQWKAYAKCEREAGREPADFETWLADKTGKGKRNRRG
jgi:hypothetical protein